MLLYMDYTVTRIYLVKQRLKIQLIPNSFARKPKRQSFAGNLLVITLEVFVILLLSWL